MVVMKNIELLDDLSEVETWGRALSPRAKAILIDCLEAGIQSYIDAEEHDEETDEAIQDVEELIYLLNKKED